MKSCHIKDFLRKVHVLSKVLTSETEVTTHVDIPATRIYLKYSWDVFVIGVY